MTTRLRRVVDWCAVGAGSLFCATILFLSTSRPRAGDDFAIALLSREHRGLWENLAWQYNNWSDRVTATLLSELALVGGRPFAFLTGLALIAMVYLTFAVAAARLAGRNRRDLYALAAILAAYWYALPALSETAFWFTGSLVYLWPMVAALAFIYVYRRWEARPDRAVRLTAVETVATASMLGLGVAIGAWQEQVLVFCVVILIGLGVSIFRQGRMRRVPPRLYAGVIGLGIGGIIILLAPGNGARLSASAAATTGVQSITLLKSYASSIALAWMPPLVPWLLVLLLFAIMSVSTSPSSADQRRGRPLSALWVTAAAASIAPLILIPAVGSERTTFFAAVLLTVAAISPLAGRDPANASGRFPVTAASVVLCVVLIMACADAALSATVAQRILREQEQRQVHIASERRRGVDDIALTPLTAARRGVMVMDASADPEYWVNQRMASWYGVRTIVVKPLLGFGSGSGP